MSARLALVTGASGYVGGLLVGRLLTEGWQVRVLTRRRSSLEGRIWVDDVDFVEGDASDPDDLRRALAGVDVAYYLVHSMAAGAGFAERDRTMAADFARAAEEASVRRTVYLGGLHPDDEPLSPHLASRVEVGRVFLDSDVPAAVLQAAVVLGDGSISFQMLRYLTDRLPVMLAPKWLHNRVQPIAIADVLHYLIAAAGLPPEVNRTFDIGGPDILTYAEMIRRFAAITGLGPRHVLTVPVLTPSLASRWIGLVTPLDTAVARPLVDSLVHEVVCRDDATLPTPPDGLTGYDDAVRQALSDAAPDHGPRNLAFATATTTACAVLGALATRTGSRWYRTLDLPAWQPPAAAFPVVWTLLYADIALVSSAALTDRERVDDDAGAAAYRRALLVNLTLNSAWSVIFWRARRPTLAALEAAVLTGSSVNLARRAGRTSPAYRVALTPYAAWCAFATALTGAIARRNPPLPRQRARSRLQWTA